MADDNCSNKGVYKATLRIPHLGSVDFIAGHLQSSLDMLECPYFWKCCGIEEPQVIRKIRQKRPKQLKYLFFPTFNCSSHRRVWGEFSFFFVCALDIFKV